ncbi:UPF0183-domain-containing protein [Calocera viscosa TUFC12733]|uniref:UPF0183-domain-containing protein n=1 Tax=Calocera viscosa (strain TUFC12733) TaxID=1330018 RepID=A0A167K868_CALVF|nr:UPF0183-domain-containing protein [Calocera viscosa TUFC12733]
MSVLDLDVRPGQGVGPCEIGASVWNVLDTIRESKARFPQVEVKFDNNDKAPATSPIILTILPHVSLLFTGITQRLHTILLHPLTPVPPHLGLRLTYKSQSISSPTQLFKRSDVSTVFGPTYKGKRRLIYPGVVFEFARGEGKDGGDSKKAGREDQVERIVVVQRDKERGGTETEEEDGLRECESMVGELKKAAVTVHEGVILHFIPPLNSPTPDPIRVTLHQTTAEDLLADLGPPLRVHYKTDERMSIHSAPAGVEEENNPYFYNYFQHGLDFLLDGETHRVIKIVIHSNVVGSALFQVYKRCPWQLIPVQRPSSPSSSSPPPPEPITIASPADTLTRYLSPSSTGDAESRSDAPPSMILDRASESRDGPLLVGQTTKLLGFDGCVLEVGEGGEVLGLVLF